MTVGRRFANNSTRFADLMPSPVGQLLDSALKRLEKVGQGLPEPHHETHEQGGSDAIKLDNLATPDDNSDLDSSTGRHGLLPKLPGGTTTFLRGDGTFAVPPPDVDGARVLLPHPPRIQKVQAGTNITITENAAGPVISSSGGGGAALEEVRALLPRELYRQRLRAGANITLTDTGLDTTIAATGGGTAVDDMSAILAGQIFGG
jgi:hypothetical protein